MKTNWIFQTQRITACRELLGLSPEQLASKIGVTGQTVRNWERGKGKGPSGETLAALANVFMFTPLGFFMLVPSKPRRVTT